MVGGSALCMVGTGAGIRGIVQDKMGVRAITGRGRCIVLVEGKVGIVITVTTTPHPHTFPHTLPPTTTYFLLLSPLSPPL